MTIREFKPWVDSKPKRSAIRRFVSAAPPTRVVDLTPKPKTVATPAPETPKPTVAAPEEVTRPATVSDVVHAINSLASFISKMEDGNRSSLMAVLENQKNSNKLLIEAIASGADKRIAMRTRFTVTSRDPEGRISEFVAEEENGGVPNSPETLMQEVNPDD